MLAPPARSKQMNGTFPEPWGVAAMPQSFVDSLSMGMLTAAAGGEASITLEAKPGMTYRLLSLDNHSQVMLPPAAEGQGARQVEIASTHE